MNTPRNRKSSTSNSWRTPSRSRSLLTPPSVSVVFGVPEQVPLPTSVVAAFPPSPLRNEILASIESLPGGPSPSRKRDRDMDDILGSPVSTAASELPPSPSTSYSPPLVRRTSNKRAKVGEYLEPKAQPPDTPSQPVGEGTPSLLISRDESESTTLRSTGISSSSTATTSAFEIQARADEDPSTAIPPKSQRTGWFRSLRKPLSKPEISPQITTTATTTDPFPPAMPPQLQTEPALPTQQPPLPISEPRQIPTPLQEPAEPPKSPPIPVPQSKSVPTSSSPSSSPSRSAWFDGVRKPSSKADLQAHRRVPSTSAPTTSSIPAPSEPSPSPVPPSISVATRSVPESEASPVVPAVEPPPTDVPIPKGQRPASGWFSSSTPSSRRQSISATAQYNSRSASPARQPLPREPQVQPNPIEATPSNPGADVVENPTRRPAQKEGSGWFSSSSSRKTSPDNRASTPAPVESLPSVPPPETLGTTDNVDTVSFSSKSDAGPENPLPLVASRPAQLLSMNPATLRYTLKLPLLGGTKVKLTDLDVPMPVLERMMTAKSGEVTTPRPDTQGIAVQEAVYVDSDGDESSRDTTPSSTPPVPAPARSSTWFGLFGGSTQTQTSSTSVNPPPNPRQLDPVVPVATFSAEPDQITTAIAEPLPPPSPSPSPIRTAFPTSPPSVMSADTSTSKTSWYMPWTAWYSSQPPPAVPPADGGKTDAELVKEEALARSEATIKPSPPPPEPARERSNPIVEPAKASWVSFFSTRNSASIKRITDGSQKDEMEVMDIDDADAPTPTSPMSNRAPRSNNGIAGKSSTAPVPPTSEPPVKQPGVPLTTSTAIKKGVANKRSPAPSTTTKKSIPNFVLPTFADTFYTAPRSLPPPTTPLKKVANAVTSLFYPPPANPELQQYQTERSARLGDKGKGKEVASTVDALGHFGASLPRVWSVVGHDEKEQLVGLKRVAIIGIHGWFPGAIMRTVLGEPTGTSSKFATMMEDAVQAYADKHGIEFEKVTKIALEGEGTIERRVEKLYQFYLDRPDWVKDLLMADAILLATHSQGSVVTTQLIDRLISEGHIRTGKNPEAAARVARHAGVVPPVNPHRVCCLALCGIHLGPLYYLNTSSLVQPYIQYFENAAARELFEFQDTESEGSKKYAAALQRVLKHGTKFVYIASLNDQVVPIYSGSFASASHPSILRALYVDGDAYSSSDFLSNLLVLLFRLRNAGLDDGNLITHLSEATAGSLSGVGHSTAYEEPATYALAVRFLFETSGVLGENPPDLAIEPFQARSARNDYEISWALRGLVEDQRVINLLGPELSELRAAFDHWQPKTTILRDVRRKLEPIRIRTNSTSSSNYNSSKL